MTGDRELAQQLRALAQRFPQVTRRMLFHAGEAIRAYMVDNMLSGQRLRRVTGRLASSFSTVNLSNDLAVVGTRVVYAGVHEYGAHGTVQVPAHTRQGHPVRSHARRLNMPARWYARDSARLGAPVALAAATHSVYRDMGEMGG